VREVLQGWALRAAFEEFNEIANPVSRRDKYVHCPPNYRE
jgi:hypothetical protein